MPPRKEKEVPKKYVDSEEEETPQDDKDAVKVLADSLSSKKPALYDGEGRLLSTGEDLCDCLDQVKQMRT